MSHANAALTPRARLKVARLVVEDGYPISEVAARFQCSWPTVKRWVERYRAGDRSMLDYSSRPHTMPAKTPLPVTKRLISLRLRRREGPVQLAARCEITPSTAHRILVRCRLNRLAHIDRATGEIHDDETAATAVAVLGRAVAWFNQRGVTIERVLSDNGSAYRSHLWRDTCAELGITPKRTRPYRPQTNGKIERFHRTLADGWAYARQYATEAERRAALPAWLHAYNHHRPHSARGSQPPFTRLTNVPGQYSRLWRPCPGMPMSPPVVGGVWGAGVRAASDTHGRVRRPGAGRGRARSCDASGRAGRGCAGR